jgi:hypothetical protein
MRGSSWGGYELLRSEQISADHGAGDGCAGFHSKEEKVVAAMDQLARGARGYGNALALGANIKRGAANMRKAPRAWLMHGARLQRGRGRGDTGGCNACCVCRGLHPAFTSTNRHPGAAPLVCAGVRLSMRAARAT